MLARLRCGAADDLGDRPHTNNSRHTAAQTLTYPGDKTLINIKVKTFRSHDILSLAFAFDNQSDSLFTKRNNLYINSKIYGNNLFIYEIVMTPATDTTTQIKRVFYGSNWYSYNAWQWFIFVSEWKLSYFVQCISFNENAQELLVPYAARAMVSIMVIDEHPMNKYIVAQRWTAFANCPVNLCESLMRLYLTVAR